MVVMAEYLTEDRLSELWRHINQLHYSYLETRDSPQKIDQRNKLEAYIKEYLCLVPNQYKFCFRETADVLNRSASRKTDFSAYRAALAWNAISMYAGNLLAQPWRNEYRQIKLYSGFYKHQIEANLIGAEIMLEVMGYKHVGDSVMVLDGPICPDRVTNVSRDSLVAFVECQIIRNIWEEVSSRFKISWLEVLEFREKYVCSPDQAVRTLTYRWHERTYHGSTHTSTHAMQPVPPSIYNASMPHIIDNYTRYQPMVVSAIAPTPIYGANSCYGYATYNRMSSYPQQRYPYPQAYPPIVTPKSPVYATTSMNGYCCPTQNGAYVAPQNGGYIVQQARTVPTGQLIELDPVPYQDNITGTSSVMYNNNSEPTITSPKARDDGTGTFESWDYVYRNLESQGYNKDIGQRGDLLSPDYKKHNRKTTKPLKITDGLHKIKLDDEVHENRVNVAHSNSYDNLSTHSSSNKHRSNFNGKTKSLPRESKSYDEKQSQNPVPQIAQTLDTKKVRSKASKMNSDQPVRAKDKSRDDVDAHGPAAKWHCNACTYLNTGKAICEMCGKSRSLVTPMSPMAVGGSECPQCTLINEKNVKICDACGANLTNSPTYI